MNSPTSRPIDPRVHVNDQPVNVIESRRPHTEGDGCFAGWRWR